MSELRAAMVEDEAALQALVPEWWSLWGRCPNATPFQSPAWLVPWWTSFRPGLLRVTTVHAGRTLVGLAPLYLEDGPYGRRLLPLGMSVSDYLDALVDPAWAADAGAALLAGLSQARGWDRIDWEELAPDASALGFAPPSGWRDAVTRQSACPVLGLPSRVEDLPARLPSFKLRKLGMARRRAERRSARIEAATPATASGLLDHLFRLHGQRWRAKGEAGVLADTTIRDFHRASLPGLLDAGLVRLTALVLDGIVAGVYYGFGHGGRAYAYLGGFDPAFGFESPGTILLGHAIEMAIREGAHEFHFLRGQEAYKYEWGAEDRWNSRRVMEPPR